jgi:hypothetical protein
LRLAFVALFFIASAWAGQDLPAKSQALGGQIREHMAENLARLPNYTCLETIDRTVRRPASKKLLFRDRVRLEVAFIEAKEMFSWPGSGNFEPDLSTLIPEAGTTGAGEFHVQGGNLKLGDGLRMVWKTGGGKQ